MHVPLYGLASSTPSFIAASWLLLCSGLRRRGIWELECYSLTKSLRQPSGFLAGLFIHFVYVAMGCPYHVHILREIATQIKVVTSQRLQADLRLYVGSGGMLCPELGQMPEDCSWNSLHPQ
eukprot:1151275-Pelagomonas_calceolata.AAC.11